MGSASTDSVKQDLADELTKCVGDAPITTRRLVEKLFDQPAPPGLISALTGALERLRESADGEDLDESLWGSQPTAGAIAAARSSGEAAVDQSLEHALRDALTRDEAARRLGITPQAVSKRRAAHALVALRRGREWRLPSWQFHEDGVLPGLDLLIAAYPGTPLALSIWATTPNADLDGLTPAQAMLTARSVEWVLSEAVRPLTPAAW